MKPRDMNRNPRGRASAVSLRKHIAGGGGDHESATFGCKPLDYCEVPPREVPGLDSATNSDRSRAIAEHEPGAGQGVPDHGKRYR